MKKEKLELKDVIGYADNTNPMLMGTDGICVMNYFSYIITGEGVRTITINSNNLKPYLYPISDLYKTIYHVDLGYIIPIVELGKKIGYNDFFNMSDEELIGAFTNGELTLEDLFNCSVEDNAMIFDFLHEIKIDFRGLIDAGLAIDINSCKDIVCC